MRSSYRWFHAVLVHLLIGIILAVPLAAPLVAPSSLPSPIGAAFAPAPAQDQTITTDCAAQTDVPQAKCEALLALYTATDGAGWRNNDGWGQDNDICSWRGVTCTNGCVTSLNLSYIGLSGSIPTELGILTKYYVLFTSPMGLLYQSSLFKCRTNMIQ